LGDVRRVASVAVAAEKEHAFVEPNGGFESLTD
jgi:hypothetical protein